MRAILTMLIAMLAGCAAPEPAELAERARAPAPPRPNIVLIVADDMGYSDLGAFGGEIPTPNIDAIGRGGVSFTEFYNSGRCWPSRAAMLTGRYPHEVGLGGELQHVDDQGRVVPPPGTPTPYQGFLRLDTPTLAERLRALGYRTYAVGKWHVGGVGRETWPTRRGFDRYFGPVTGTDSYFRAQTNPARPRRYVEDETPWTLPPGFYATDAFTDRGVRFIAEAARERRPFFLYMAYTAPHWPLQAPAADVARQRGRYDRGWDAVRRDRFERARTLGVLDAAHALPPRPDDIPAWTAVEDKERAAERMEVYAAQMVALDRGVGRLLDALRRTGADANTLVLFLSDNGATREDLSQGAGRRFNDPAAPAGSAARYESYGRGWAFVSNTPYRQYKTEMGEGGIKTPLLARWPRGVAGAGRLSRQVGHVVDIAPTLVEIAGGRGGWAAGTSLAGPLTHGDEVGPRRLFFVDGRNRAVRDGRWKAVRDAGGPWRLYDLREDPTELRNLAAARPEVLRALVDHWFDWARRVGVRELDGADAG